MTRRFTSQPIRWLPPGPSHRAATHRFGAKLVLPAAFTCILVLSLVVDATHAGPSNNDPGAGRELSEADRLVQEALSHEVYGDLDQRTRLLSEAIQLEPDHNLARWHLGYLYHDGQWMRPDQVKEDYESDAKIALYLERRDAASNDAESQYELAMWCQERRLHAQEKAHLFRVLQLEPNHIPTRQRLGFRMIDGEWVAAEDLLEAQQAQVEDIGNFVMWQDRIADIRQRLHRDNAQVRERAERELLEIRDPNAIPAIEAIISSDVPEIAMLAVHTIGAINDLDASTSLARHAVFAAQADVRQLAALELRDRDPMHFVPDLLAELKTPIMSIEQILPGRGRRLVHRRVYFQEGQDEQRALIEDTSYHRVMPIGDSRQTWNRALQSASVESGQRNQLIQWQNLQTNELNERICQTLRIATGEDLPSQPLAWWQWWNQDNDILIEGSKTLLTSYQTQEVDVIDSVDTTPSTQPVSSGQMQTPSPRSCECLIRGTLIWTASGPVAIESIQIGDLVLAKDVETGELAYRPVLRTTTRPSGPLVQVSFADESFRSSPGHPFWVSGEGWVKAKDLQSGMELHTASGCVRISNVEPADAEETFNLVIDGFASYFVGANQVLSHDHTMPEPTTRVVPGLDE